MILKSAVEHGFVGNLSVPGKASFAVNGYSRNKNNNAAGWAEIFHKFMSPQWVQPAGEDEVY
jgi:hypothetical protein